MSNLAFELQDNSKKNTKKVSSKAFNERMFKRKFFTNISMLIGFAILLTFGYINGRADVSKVQAEVNTLKSQISSTNKEIGSKEAKLEQVRSSKLVEEQAQTLLGMIYPDENDKIYINSKETDEKLATKKNPKESFLGALFR